MGNCVCLQYNIKKSIPRRPLGENSQQRKKVGGFGKGTSDNEGKAQGREHI